MFNQTKVISPVIIGIALFFSISCGANKPTAVLIASRPLEQPVEVSPDNAGEGEVLPQPSLNLSNDARLSSTAAPRMTTPEEIIRNGDAVPVVENKVSSEKIIEPGENRASQPVPIIENQGNWPDPSPEILRQQQSAVSAPENGANAALVGNSDLSPLSHWEQRWLVPK